MSRVSQLTIASFLALSAGSAVAMGEWCPQISDRQHIEEAIIYELKRTDLSGDFQFTSIDEFLDANPNCCNVDRGDHTLKPELSLVERWFFPDDSILTEIIYLPRSSLGESLYVSYVSSPCGQIADRYSYSVPIENREIFENEMQKK